MGMTDHSAWLGHWPLRNLRGAGEIEALLRDMDRVGVERTWVSPLAAVFHRVPHDANLWLLRETAKHPDRLLLVPILLPGLSDAAEHLRDLLTEAPGLAAIRMLPGWGPRPQATLLQPLQSLLQKRTVLWTVRMVDDRTRHPMFPLPVADLGEVILWFRALLPERLVVTGCQTHELRAHASAWKLEGAICVETSFLDGPDAVEEARRLLGHDKVLDGSNAPLHVIDAMAVDRRTLPPPAEL